VKNTNHGGEEPLAGLHTPSEWRMRRAPVLTHNRQTPAFIFYTALKGTYPRPFIRGTPLRRSKLLIAAFDPQNT
jgi:hypothetical protein